MVYSNLLIHNNILDKSSFYIKTHNKKHISPYLSKTLHIYLSNVKKLIEECHEEWDNKKKITNPYEYIHTLIAHKRISVSLYKPLSRSFFKLIELSNTHYLLSDYTKTNINTFSLAEGPGGFIEALMWLRNNKEDKYYGITLISANTVVYYSNGYDLEKRMQSEDRAHRIGQKKKVTYVDLIAEDTVDNKIVKSLRKKINIAAEVMGEDIKKWI